VSLLESPSVARAIIDTLFWMDSHGRITLGAFVIMPDHYHAVLIPGFKTPLSSVMKTIGSFAGREIAKVRGHGGQVWQAGYYDRGVRKSEDIVDVFDYVHHNPVRKGLVDRAEKWPYSSRNPRYYERISWHLFT
jgi:putative transposase